MRPRAAARIATLLALAGCTGAPPVTPEEPGLATTCALRQCRCLSDDLPFFLARKETPILWRENGDAYCPDGFELVLNEPAKQP